MTVPEPPEGWMDDTRKWLEEENINFDDLKLVCPLTDTELLATYSSECRYTSLVSLTTLSLVFDIQCLISKFWLSWHCVLICSKSTGNFIL